MTHPKLKDIKLGKRVTVVRRNLEVITGVITRSELSKDTLEFSKDDVVRVVLDDGSFHPYGISLPYWSVLVEALIDPGWFASVEIEQ